MKKLVCLLLAALICLCSLIPAVAEEAPAATELPDITLPIALADYQKAYETIVTANAPDYTVTWSSTEQDSGIIWMATINDSFVSVMLLADGENVAEVACVMQSELSENALLTFLSMGGYSGAALMLDEDTDAVAASEAFMVELFTVFTAMVEGVSPESICGLPGGMSISVVDESTYQYYFIMRLNGTAADDAAE